MTNFKRIKLINILIICIFILINNDIYAQKSFNNYVIKFKNDNSNKNSTINNLNNLNNLNIEIDKVIIKYNLNVSNFSKNIYNSISNYSKNNNIQKINNIEVSVAFDNIYLCENNSKLKEFLEDYENDNLNNVVEYIVPNYIYKIENSNITNDSRINEQWALQKLNAGKLWEYATGKGIVVGVIDTGIDWQHQDMKNQLWINKSEDLNNNGVFDSWSVNEVRDGIKGDLDNIDNDNNGFVDDVIGYDFVDQFTFNFGDYRDYDPIPFDENGHGTNVSSVINAENNNNFGISGLAINSKIITARAFDATGSGESDDIAASIIYCALNGAKVLNFSFGERFKSPIIEDAVKFAASKGCIMVSSSGNNNWWFEHYPSDLKEVLSVGSSTIEDNKDSFSNYGSFVDVLAPGNRILVATPNNGFKFSSGTSLSSPYVVSLVAMMLEIDSTLNYNNIFSIIKTNCNDIGIEGWDYINSAGVINPLKTLQNLYKSNISFVDIPNEIYIDKTNLPILDLKANVIEPLFKNYEVKIAQGLYPLEKDFITIDSGKSQVFGGLIAKLELSKLKDTLYTVSLVVNRSNRSQLQQRFKLNVNSTFNKLEITDKKIYEALKDNKKVLIVHIYTNKDSYIDLKYKKKNNTSNEGYKTLQNYDKFTSNHILVIEDTLGNLDEINFEATVFNNNFDNYNGINNIKTENFDYKILNNNPFKLDFISKKYSLPPSYLSKDVIVNDKNEKFIITNEYENGAQFGKIYLNKFEKINNTTTIIKVDSLNDLSVNLNIGKINNENYLLTTSEFRNAVYKIDINNQKFEQKSVYQSGNLKREWGGAFIDLDKDGNSELVNYNDTNFVAFKYINNNFIEVANTDNINKEVIGINGKRIVPRKLSTKPAFEFGDFGNEKNVFMFEIENILYTYKVNLDVDNNISFNFLKNYNYFNSKGRTIKQLHLIDRNGNKINDICVLTNGDADFDKLRQVSDNTWTIEILEDNFQNEIDIDFNPLYTERVYGYKDGFISNFGFSYKNNMSVVAFDANTNSNQELVLSLTPNLYIIKKLKDEDLLNKKTKVHWYPFNFSNDIIYDDFDNNGIKELVVNFFGGVEFLELNKNPIQISGFDGYPKNENSAFLFWDKYKLNNDFAITDYEIYKITNITKGELEFINTTKANNIIISNLVENTNYEFLIRGTDSTDKSNVKNGQFSYPITVNIFAHKQISPRKTELLDSTQIYVEFNGKLPLNYIDKSKFIINNLASNNTLNIFSVLRLNENKLLIKLKEKFINGNYQLIVKSFDDLYRTPTIEDSLLFSYNYSTDNYLHLVRLEQSENKLKLFFNDSINFQDVTINNFELMPYGRINELVYNYNEFDNEKSISNNITLYLDDYIFKNTQGIIYNIKAQNIKSINNLEMTQNEGSSLSFVLRQSSLNEVYTLPNPFKYSKNELLTFGNLTLNSKIEIYDLNGNILKELVENDGDGGITWDLKDKNNNLIIEGIYLYKITGLNDNGENFESELKKFAVLP